MLLYAFLGNITYLTEHGSINIESFIKDLGKKFHIKKIAYDQEGVLWEIMCREMEPQKVQQAVPCYGMAIFHDEGHKEHNPDVEIQSAVVGTYQDTEHVKFKTVPPIQVASATYKGSYDQISRVNAAVADWVVTNGYDFDGKSFCIYHVSPSQTNNPEELVTKVCFPVRKE